MSQRTSGRRPVRGPPACFVTYGGLGCDTRKGPVPLRVPIHAAELLFAGLVPDPWPMPRQEGRVESLTILLGKDGLERPEDTIKEPSSLRRFDITDAVGQLGTLYVEETVQKVGGFTLLGETDDVPIALRWQGSC